MPWLTLLAASGLVSLITFGPGLVAGRLLNLRGLTLWAASAPFGLSMVAVASVVLPLLKIDWSLVAVLAFAFVCLAIVAVIRVLAMRTRETPPADGERHPSSRRGWWTFIALAVAAAIITAQVGFSIGTPGAVSQTFDNVFHLDAIRYIVDTRDASPLWVGTMTNPDGGLPFYPDTWHALAALVVSTLGVSIPVAANAITVVFAALVWPAGAMLLTRVLFGSRRAVTFGAALVASALPAFPLLMITYGVLYPLFLGLAVLPMSVVAAVQVLRIGRDSAEHPPWVWVVVVVGCVPGMTLAHPGAFMAWLAIVAVAVVIASTSFVMSRPPRRASLSVAVALAGFGVVSALALWVLRPPDAARTWQPIMTMGQAFGEVLTASMYSAPVSIIALFLIVGLIAAYRRRSRVTVFAVASFGVVAALYIVCAALPYWWLRDLLVGAWYDNTPRLAAIVPVMVVPLAAFGIAKTWDLVRQVSVRIAHRRSAPTHEPLLVTVAAITGIVVILGWTQWTMRSAVRSAYETYASTEASPLLTADERALIDRVDQHVPADAIIAGSPWTGTSLVYALADRRVLMPHIFSETTDDIDLINTRLRDATAGDEVCRAIRREHVRYVLDFGTQEVHHAHHDFGGVSDLEGSSAVRLLDEQGDARLYKVVACGDVR